MIRKPLFVALACIAFSSTAFAQGGGGSSGGGAGGGAGSAASSGAGTGTSSSSATSGPSAPSGIGTQGTTTGANVNTSSPNPARTIRTSNPQPRTERRRPPRKPSVTPGLVIQLMVCRSEAPDQAPATKIRNRAIYSSALTERPTVAGLFLRAMAPNRPDSLRPLC